jgi:RNA polymerase sigma-70 factor (ECF subfamily)
MMPHSPDEGALGARIEILLRQARAGSAEVLGQLFEAFRPLLLGLARARLSPDLRAKLGSSDLVQITYADAQRDFPAFAGATPEEFRAWLVQIHERNLLNEVRRFKGTRMRDCRREAPLADTGSGLAGGEPTPSEVLSHQEEEELLRLALDRLPPGERDLVLLRQDDSLSWQEIADRLGDCTAAAASKRWARILEKLQGLIEAIQHESRAGP